MVTTYCPVCKKITGHKRNVGAGTVLAALVTFAISVFAIPFYPKRRIVCGNAYAAEHYPVASVLKFEEDILSGRYTKAAIIEMHGAPSEYLHDFCRDMVNRGRWSQEACEDFLEMEAKENGRIECPFCAETIKRKAVICRFCGRDLPQEAV
jgi:hypothetical protein